jgi:hypothetical protein
MDNDQPTEITPEGDKIWRNAAGKPHRDGAPAVIFANGDRYWYQNGELHREDGPACEFFSGSKEWYLHGHHHRYGGPAIEHNDGHKEWWVNGMLHREGGPAVEGANGDKFWYLNSTPHREGGPSSERTNGDKEWRQNGLLHREDGPAIDSNGCKSWYREGELHREDGPAMMLANGDKYWYQNDRLHRADGPAIEEHSSGNRLWYLNGLIHREDGPASELPGEGKFWYRNGVLHREDGPAIERKDGRREYWINGERIEPPISPAQQRAVILGVLVESGWVPYDLSGGIAAKAFSTENGCVIAHAYLSPEDDGFNRVLSGSYWSEGRDVLSASSALIPVTATGPGCRSLAEKFTKSVESVMSDVLPVKLLRHNLITHIVYCFDLGWTFVHQKPGADEFHASELKVTSATSDLTCSTDDVQNSLRKILDIGEKYVHTTFASKRVRNVFTRARDYLSKIERLQEEGKRGFEQNYCQQPCEASLGATKSSKPRM